MIFRSDAKQMTQGRRSALEEARRSVMNVTLGVTPRYTEDSVRASTFEEWARWAGSLRNPDSMRNGLYYGFQPVYDLLISEQDGALRMRIEDRQMALAALNGIVDATREYLAGYYRGMPNTAMAAARIRQLAPAVSGFGPAAEYIKRDRNIDKPLLGLTPGRVLSFTRQLAEHIADGEINMPDCVVVAACGASEIGLAVGGILGIDVGFMRRSKKRGDRDVRTIREHEPELERMLRGKTVLCVEDLVTTAKTLKELMTVAQLRYGAAEVYGASVKVAEDGDFVTIPHYMKNTSFNLYGLRW